MNILQINSSARSSGAQSTRLADLIVGRLRERNPAAQVTVRDLARDPHPTLDEAALQALFTPEAERSEAQQARVALDDALIVQLQAADTLVLGAPMYNFGVTAQLKNWLDAVARARVTFRYTEHGVEGLLTGKTVYVALTRGGKHRETERDTQVPYLKTMLGFLGMADVRFIYAEGMAMGAQAVEQAFAEATIELEAALA